MRRQGLRQQQIQSDGLLYEQVITQLSTNNYNHRADTIGSPYHMR